MAQNNNNGKSLNEKINDVMNAKTADRTKKRSLIKLGLRGHEIDFIFAEFAKAQIGDFDFSKLTFGIEIECYNCVRTDLIYEAHLNGLEIHSEAYNHADNSRYYKIVSDGSLTGNDTNEVVSPILNGENGLQSLRTLCNALAAVNARVNKSCGLHVHIGAANISDEHYCRIFRNYQAIETAIDTFMALSRRSDNAYYCKSLRRFDFNGCTTKGDIARALGYRRYFKVNAEAYNRHHTVEFRQHQGTTDYEKISHWVKFLAALVQYSFKHDCPTCTRIEDIPFISDEEKAFFTARRAALN